MSASNTPATSGEPTNTTAVPDRAEKTTAIRVLVGETVLQATLRDNAAARSFIEQLPLTLPVEDYGGQEKIATPPRSLSMDGMPPGDDPQPQDIGYYVPDGVLVFYYADVGYYNGIALLGRFDSPIDDLIDVPDGSTVTVELT